MYWKVWGFIRRLPGSIFVPTLGLLHLLTLKWILIILLYKFAISTVVLYCNCSLNSRIEKNKRRWVVTHMLLNAAQKSSSVHPQKYHEVFSDFWSDYLKEQQLCDQTTAIWSHSRFSFTGKTSESPPTQPASNMSTAPLFSCGHVAHIKTFYEEPDSSCMGSHYWATHQKLPEHLLPTRLHFVTGKFLMMMLGHKVPLIKTRWLGTVKIKRPTI